MRTQQPLLQFAPDYLPKPRSGKVREIFDFVHELVIVSTDRISAFDVCMPDGIPDKGKILNQMSAYWFKELSDVSPHHVITTDAREIGARIGYLDVDMVGRSMLAHKTQPLMVECVARGYIAGSLYKEYRQHGNHLHGLTLPEGLVVSDRLPEPIFTPATKAEEGHDENISFDQMVEIVGGERAEILRDRTLTLYRRAAAAVEPRGLILADTKFEFGLTRDKILWIDEALTPDSSRFWDAALYQPGQSQPSFDKQFLRDYLEQSGWNKLPPAPDLPDEVIEGVHRRYLEAFERITGSPFAA